MSILQQRMIARVQGSPHRLTLVFPAATPTVTSVPVNPFGPTPTATALPAPVTPSRAPLTIKCLWADGLTPSDLTSRTEQAMRREVGWYSEATAVARVLVSEAAVDPTKPYGETWFDRVHHVEFSGKQFEVVQCTPVAASFAHPVTYAVWLKGAQQQTP